MWYHGWILAIAVLAWMQAVPAKAYTVKSGFTEGCHERITAEAFMVLLDDPRWPEVVVPGGNTWRNLARPLNQWLFDQALIDEALPEPQLFVLFSLVVGARSPDTDGRSVSDLSSQRSINLDPRPEAQYVHAIRAAQDDEPEGSQNTVTGTRASIRQSFSGAAAASLEPAEEQISAAPFTLDFYNLFHVEVWQPGFLLGEAAHTLQDSFSHSIRDEIDLGQILHVLNYVDAVYTHFNESRDGIAHSRHLDRCDAAELRELRDAVDLATEDLLDAFLRTQAGDESALDDFVDEWVTFQEGCTFENDFCGNKWVAEARKDPTSPILPNWMICSAGVGPARATWIWAMAASILVVLAARRLSAR